jgi:hypothetical protein
METIGSGATPMSQEQVRPHLLKIVHVRFPPTDPFFSNRDIGVELTRSSGGCLLDVVESPYAK